MEHNLKISGMSCGHCVHAVRRALERIPGIIVKDVDIGSATIEDQDIRSREETIRNKLDEEGYDLSAVE